MLFTFLKYLQPTHYFQLYRKDGRSVFPIPEQLPETVLKHLHSNSHFTSEKAKRYDLSWQAIQKGYIGNDPTYTEFEKVPISDEYVFIRLYFHEAWVFYIFILRLLTLKNPIKEWKGWWQSKQVKRQNILTKIFSYPNWDIETSKLINKKELVSVVIPTLNRYSYLKNILKDFEKQTYSNFEIVIVDQSKPFQKEFYNQFNLNINLIYQEEPALWLARNTAIKKAKGSIIALSEDDVRIPDSWIESHLHCLHYFKGDISAGVFYPEGSTIPEERSFFCIANQFATGNAALYIDVFKKIGLFDRQFEKQRMGDGEFGLRAYLEGLKSISNPHAFCLDVKAETGGLRQMGSWDAFRPKKWLAPRPIPSVVYYFRRYFGITRTCWALLRAVPLSIMPYRFKQNKPLMLLGGLIAVILAPLVCIQVMLSWRQASKKIKQGPSISELK